MPLDDLIARPIHDIEPFDDLPVNAALWQEAHDHHRIHRQIHAVAAHRPGIVYGLEVTALGGNRVVVAPGVAIDEEGQAIQLPVPYQLEFNRSGTQYIVASFRFKPDPASARTVGDGERHFRVVEDPLVIGALALPDEPHLELARISRSSADAPVREAANRFDPGRDELNLLHRVLAFPHCYADTAVGELPYLSHQEGGWRVNRAGLWSLLHEGNGRGFHLRFTGPANLNDAATFRRSGTSLLYMAGPGGFVEQPAPQQVEGLRRFLDDGGVLVGDASGGNDGFAASFGELAKNVGAKLKPLPKGHPLLREHYIFGAPPPGASGRADIAIDDERGVVLSRADYGAAWQGDIPQPEAPDARERIRQTLEFGLNLVAFAARRRRRVEMARAFPTG